MKKVFAYAVKAFAFANSAQGKRDVALFVAAVSAAVSAYHVIFG